MTNFFSLQKSKKEATNFDTEFTKEDPVLTPINQEIVKTIDQVLRLSKQTPSNVKSKVGLVKSSLD